MGLSNSPLKCILASIGTNANKSFSIAKSSKFLVPSDLIVKKVNKDSGEISDGQNTIIDYFTKEQLEILDNINKVESIGGIN